MSPNAPHNPDKLVGTKWTAANPQNRRKHWEVVEHVEADQVLLRAVLDGESITIPWRDLRNRDDWQPGWT
jgi:tryptophan-rich hypothetical protein